MDNLAPAHHPTENTNLGEPLSPEVLSSQLENKQETLSNTGSSAEITVPTASQTPLVSNRENTPIFDSSKQPIATIPEDNTKQRLLAGLASQFIQSQDPDIISRVSASSLAEQLSVLVDRVNTDFYSSASQADSKKE